MKVYVPAALMKVRIPSSLNKFRFAAEGEAGEASIDSMGNTLPIAAPATGNTVRLLMTSLRFISLNFLF